MYSGPRAQREEVQHNTQVEWEDRGLCQAFLKHEERGQKNKGKLRQIGDDNLVLRRDELRTPHIGDSKRANGQGWSMLRCSYLLLPQNDHEHMRQQQRLCNH